MAIFNSYVKLPDGIFLIGLRIFHVWKIANFDLEMFFLLREVTLEISAFRVGSIWTFQWLLC